MDKIKTEDISLLEKISKIIFPDLLSEVTLRLAVAKNIFLLACVFYYTVYLSIVGGLLGPDMGAILSLGYGAMAFSTFFLLYTLVDYALVIYFEHIRNTRYAAGGVIVCLFLVVVLAKIGLFHTLVS